MQKLLLLVLSAVLIFSGCNNNSSNTVWVTIKMPYVVDTGASNIRDIVDLGVTPLEVKVIDSLNTGAKIASIDNGNKIVVIYNSEPLKDKPKALDYNLINYDGVPAFLYTSTISVKINSSDLVKIKESLRSLEHSVPSQDNAITCNSLKFIIQNLYTGKITYQSVQVERDKENIKDTLKRLASVFTQVAELDRSNYLKDNPDMVKQFNAWLDGTKNNNEKAERIARIVNKEQTSFSDDMTKKAQSLFEGDNAYLASVDYVWKQKQAYCVSTAYMVKAMLDSQGIKNKVMLGYIKNSIHSELNGTAHALNAIWDEESKKWLWLDGTTGGFNDPRMYVCLEENEILNLSDK